MDPSLPQPSLQHAPAPATPVTLTPVRDSTVLAPKQSPELNVMSSPQSHSRSGSEAASERGAPTPAPPPMMPHDSLVSVRLSQDETAPSTLDIEPSLPPMKSPIFDNPTVAGYQYDYAPAQYSLPVEEPIYQEPIYQEPTYIEPTYTGPTYAEPAYVEPTYIEPVYEQLTYNEPAYPQLSGVQAAVASLESQSQSQPQTQPPPVLENVQEPVQYMEPIVPQNVYQEPEYTTNDQYYNPTQNLQFHQPQQQYYEEPKYYVEEPQAWPPTVEEIPSPPSSPLVVDPMDLPLQPTGESTGLQINTQEANTSSDIDSEPPTPRAIPMATESKSEEIVRIHPEPSGSSPEPEHLESRSRESTPTLEDAASEIQVARVASVHQAGSVRMSGSIRMSGSSLASSRLNDDVISLRQESIAQIPEVHEEEEGVDDMPRQSVQQLESPMETATSPAMADIVELAAQANEEEDEEDEDEEDEEGESVKPDENLVEKTPSLDPLDDSEAIVLEPVDVEMETKVLAESRVASIAASPSPLPVTFVPVEEEFEIAPETLPHPFEMSTMESVPAYLETALPASHMKLAHVVAEAVEVKEIEEVQPTPTNDKDHIEGLILETAGIEQSELTKVSDLTVDKDEVEVNTRKSFAQPTDDVDVIVPKIETTEVLPVETTEPVSIETTELTTDESVFVVEDTEVASVETIEPASVKSTESIVTETIEPTSTEMAVQEPAEMDELVAKRVPVQSSIAPEIDIPVLDSYIEEVPSAEKSLEQPEIAAIETEIPNDMNDIDKVIESSVEHMSMVETPAVYALEEEDDINELPPLHNKAITRVAAEEIHSDISEFDDMSSTNNHDSYRDTRGLEPITFGGTPELPLPTPDLTDFQPSLRSPIPEVSIEDHDDMLEAQLEAQRIIDDEIYSDPEEFPEEPIAVTAVAAIAVTATFAVDHQQEEDVRVSEQAKEEEEEEEHEVEEEEEPKVLIVEDSRSDDERLEELENEELEYEPPHFAPTQEGAGDRDISPTPEALPVNDQPLEDKSLEPEADILLPSTRYSPRIAELELEPIVYKERNTLETEPQVAVDVLHRPISPELDAPSPEPFVPDVVHASPRSRALTPEPQFLPESDILAEPDDFQDAYSRSPSPEMEDDDVVGQIMEPDIVSPESTPKLSPVVMRNNVRAIHESPSTDGEYSLQDIPLSSDSSDQGSRDSISDRHSSISGSLQTTPVQRRSLRDSLRIDTCSISMPRNLDVIAEAEDDEEEEEVNWDKLQKKEDATPKTPGQDKMTALLLARLEQENAKFSMPKPPPVTARQGPPNATKSATEQKRKSRPPSMAQLREMVRSPFPQNLRYSQIAMPQMTDLEFYAALVKDYQKAAARFPNLLSHKIRKGIPPPLRGVVWQSMAGARDPPELEDKFDELVNQTSPYERIVNKDLGRSFPGVDMFRDPEGNGQMMLGRVLKCLSIYIPKLGYCQGLAFVVGPLLMHMPDKQAFCVLVRLMERYDLQASYQPDLAGLHARIFQFRALLETTVPAVAKHLDELQVESAYVSQWFLSVFATTCPLPMLFRMYDVLFAEGAHETLMRVALSLMQKNEERIIKCTEPGDVMHLLLSRGLWDCYHYNADEFVESFTALSDAVTREKLQALEQAYREQQAKTKEERGRERERECEHERDEGGARSKSAMAMVSLTTSSSKIGGRRSSIITTPQSLRTTTANDRAVKSTVTASPASAAAAALSSEIAGRNRSGSDASIGMINPKVAAVSAAASRFLGRIWATNTGGNTLNTGETGVGANNGSGQNLALQGPTSSLPGASSTLTSPPNSNPTPTSQSQGILGSGSVLGSGFGAALRIKTGAGSTPTSSTIPATITTTSTANKTNTHAGNGSTDVGSLSGSAPVPLTLTSSSTSLPPSSSSSSSLSTTAAPTTSTAPASASASASASATTSTSISVSASFFKSAATAISSAVLSSSSSSSNIYNNNNNNNNNNNRSVARSGDVKSLTVTVPSSSQTQTTSSIILSSTSTSTATAASVPIATTNTLSPGLAPSPRTLSMLRRSTSKQSLASTLNSMEAASNSSILSSASTTSTSTEATTISLSSRDSGSAESNNTVLPIAKPVAPPAPSPTTSAFNTKQALAPSSKSNADDRYLHNQIEDLLAALTQLQLNHAILSSDLERERDEREDDKRAVQSLMSGLRHKADVASDEASGSAPTPEELAQLLDTVEQRFGLVETGDEGDSDKSGPKKSTGMSKADLEDELRSTKDQIAASKSQSQSLERRIYELEQDVSTLREQLKESQGRVRTMHQDKQRIEKQIKSMRMSRVSTSPISGVTGAAESIRNAFNVATGTPTEDKVGAGGLRELRLGRGSSSPSTSTSPFSQRASCMRTRDSIMTLSAAAAQGEKPTSEQDALLLELVQAKTGEAMAKAEVEELKQKVEALKKQYGAMDTTPNRNNTAAAVAPVAAGAGGGFWGGWRR